MFNLEISYFVFILMSALIASSIVGIFLKRKRGQFISSTAILTLIAISSLYLSVENYTAVLGGLIRINPFSMLFALLFSVSMVLVNVLSYAYSKDYIDLSLLLGFSFAGMLIIATAGSVISIFLGLELVAVSTSFMILFEGKNRIEAAVKFFILSSISAAVFSFALALLFPYDPQLTLVQATLGNNVAGISVLLLSIVMFVAALGFDSALFPFNFWIPDVYEGSPGYITSLLAGINKKVAFVALIEVFFVVFLPYRTSFAPIFVLLSILTMFFGNLIALVQKNIKRLFAYSSISQAGYILVGLAASTQFGIEASIFYIIAHAFMIIGAFSIVLWLESKNIKTIEDYTGLNSRNRFAAAALTIFMLSMAGIPPLMGFTGKFLLFSSAISANILILAIFGIISSFISIYYYAKVISSMYSAKNEKPLKIDPYVASVVIFALIVIVLFGIYPQPIIAVASKASSVIFGGI